MQPWPFFSCELFSMRIRTFSFHAALFCLIWQLPCLLVGQGFGGSATLCFGLDGHTAVEAVSAGDRCGSSLTSGARPLSLKVTFDGAETCCGPCLDLPTGVGDLLPSAFPGLDRLLKIGAAAHVLADSDIVPVGPAAACAVCPHQFLPSSSVLEFLQNVVLLI